MTKRLPSRLARAFSLIEIVLALGVISFALVGILGLFPVALNAAADSQRETQAALIARSIFSDLASRPGTRTSLATGSVLSAGSVAVNLKDALTYYLGYDADGVPKGAFSSAQYQDGVAGDAVYVARVVVRPDLPEVGISNLLVSVEAPAGAKRDLRKRYLFVSLLDQDIPQKDETP